jgi:hypothetical protein
LFRRFLLFGGLSLLILYLGALGVGRSPGFAFLVATRVGDVLGDSLTAAKGRVSPDLRRLEVFDLVTQTNRNQKVLHTRMERVGLDWDYRRVTRVEIEGLTCDVHAQRGGGWTPTALGVLARLPLLNRVAPSPPPRASRAVPDAFAPLPEPGMARMPETGGSPAAPDLNFRALPEIVLRRGGIRLYNAMGELLADIQNLDLHWTPAAANPDGAERLAVRARYHLPARKIPPLPLEVVVTAREGRFTIEKLEAEQALLLEAGRFLDQLGSAGDSGADAGAAGEEDGAPAAGGGGGNSSQAGAAAPVGSY